MVLKVPFTYHRKEYFIHGNIDIRPIGLLFGRCFQRILKHLDIKLVKMRYRSVMIDLIMLPNAIELSFILTS